MIASVQLDPSAAAVMTGGVNSASPSQDFSSITKRIHMHQNKSINLTRKMSGLELNRLKIKAREELAVKAAKTIMPKPKSPPTPDLIADQRNQDRSQAGLVREWKTEDQVKDSTRIHDNDAKAMEGMKTFRVMAVEASKRCQETGLSMRGLSRRSAKTGRFVKAIMEDSGPSPSTLPTPTSREEPK